MEMDKLKSYKTTVSGDQYYINIADYLITNRYYYYYNYHYSIIITY